MKNPSTKNPAEPKKQLKLLWLCGIPSDLQTHALNGRQVGAHAAWSWVMGHLPPPPGVDLHIACPARNIPNPLQVEYQGATFHLFPTQGGAAYTLYRSWHSGFQRVYNTVQPDWVHGWGTEAGFGSAALALAPRRSVVEIQGILSDFYPYMQRSAPLAFSIVNERITLHKASRLLTESDYSAQATKKYTRGQVGVVFHPLRDDFLQLPAGTKQKKQIIFLGALTERKGIKDTLHAFAGGTDDTWSLICIGKGAPEYEKEVRDLIHHLGIQARVELRGTLNSTGITELFQDSPVFLLPTYMDTGPTALKEALAMGLWPVCYDNSGPKELIHRYQYGSVSPTGNIPLLTNTLRNVLRDQPWKNPDRMEQCIQQIRHDLSRETIWKQLLNCYTDAYWAMGAGR